MFKNLNSDRKEDKSMSSPVGCFQAVLDQVRSQLDIDSLLEVDLQTDELCYIIAETLLLSPTVEIKIAGNKMSAGIVQEIYSLLRWDHIALVKENLSKITYEINHMKTYLRTALYNSFFELESTTQNRINKDVR